MLISNPDMFLGEEFNIHGVLGPFSSLQREVLQGADFIHSPTCPSFKSDSTYEVGDFKNFVEWNKDSFEDFDAR
jgi:hypothetical protein